MESMTKFEQCLQLFPSYKSTSLADQQQPITIKKKFSSTTADNKLLCAVDQSQSPDNLLITNIYDTFLECHVNLALCLIRLAHFEEAVSCLTSILHYAPLCTQAYYLRGKAFFCLNEYQIALDDLESVKKTSSSSEQN